MAEHNTDLNYGSFRNHQELMRAIGSRIQSKEHTIFFGTLDEWNALPDSEKAKYSTVKTPDEAGAKIINVIEENNPNAASSGAVFNALTSKVDKVTGKGLSSNDYTDAEKTKLADLENYDDSDIRSEIADLDEAKVDKVTGKSLSTNDYTTAEKTKLANIENGAQTNVIESIEVNGSAQPINNKIVAITVMTNAVDDLVNYYKKSETYTQEEVNNLIGLIPKFSIKVVESLPVTDISYTTVYLLKTSETETGNLYTEYIYVKVSEQTSQWEKLGTQTLDLSDYVTITDLNNALANYTTTTALNSLLNGKVDKVNGKGLSTNDYTDADKALVADSPITVTATASPISTANGKPRAITIYGKSEVVDGAIKSAGEGWSTVDLGTLTWIYIEARQYFRAELSVSAISADDKINGICSIYTADTINNIYQMISENKTIGVSRNIIFVKDTDYTTVSELIASLGDVTLTYQLADPSQGNAIAVKTDDGTGINGTMAVFETGTPLRGITGGARDVMTWDGSSGAVTKRCNKVRLADLAWEYNTTYELFYTSLSNYSFPITSTTEKAPLLCDKYTTTTQRNIQDKCISGYNFSTSSIMVKDTDYTTTSDFVASLGDAELVYELATPTTEQLTQTENESIATLRTFTPTTHITNNAGADMTVEAYAGTANGKAVNELKQDVQKQIDDIKLEKSHFCYSYKIDMNNSDPFTNCKPHFDTRYGCDNFNFTSAHMDYANDKFEYGSWEGFIRRIARPCMLKYDGTVDYYLDPDDYSKKITGEASDVSDVNYQGNAMVELEKLYFKRYTYNGIQYCFIADRKLDKSFKAYAHHDKYGKELDYIYRACYDGMYDGTRLRSISGIDYHNLNTLTAGYIMSNTTRQEEMNFAKANNVSTEQGEGWNILHKSEWDYINDILVLISMSTDTQGTFGRGRDSGYVSTSDTGIISTGTMDTKGLFWGENDGTAGVKVLGIENHWANIFKSCAGWMLISNQHYTKMTFGTEDGSTGTGFNTDGTGYLATGASISANGYISDWAENDNGFLPTAASGSASTYRCDYVWQNTATYFALVGSDSNNGLRCGAFCSNLSAGAGNRRWAVGAALSYKPLSAA